MKKIMARYLQFYYQASHLPEVLAPVFDLGLRLYLANVFFKSGLTKMSNWDSTLYLFSDVYHVPLLPPDIAAIIATSGELCLSVFLAVGLFGKFATAGLFILNVIAAISYPELSEAGLNQHISWGMLLSMLLVLSKGSLSMDALLEKSAARR